VEEEAQTLDKPREIRDKHADLVVEDEINYPAITTTSLRPIWRSDS